MGEHGVTLVDVLMALALLGIMALAVFLAFRANFTTLLTIQQYAGEQENGRTVVNQVAPSLRMLRYDFVPTPTKPAVIYANPHEVDFFADLDKTGIPQCYRFYLNAGIVYQAKVTGGGCDASITAAAGQPLTAASEAKALTFTELDFSYWSAADLGDGELTDNPLTLNDRSLIPASVGARPPELAADLRFGDVSVLSAIASDSWRIRNKLQVARSLEDGRPHKSERKFTEHTAARDRLLHGTSTRRAGCLFDGRSPGHLGIQMHT